MLVRDMDHLLLQYWVRIRWDADSMGRLIWVNPAWDKASMMRGSGLKVPVA